MLDLKRLHALRQVACKGSFSAAAEALYVSQSAVSQQIAALEAEVGTPLLLRLRGGPVLTDAGKLLVNHADAAIARLEQAERELAELSGLGAGELRLVSFPSASATIVTGAAGRFRADHPEVHLQLAEADPEDSLPALKRGEHDLALVYDYELQPIDADPDLAVTPLLSEVMHIALPRDHRLAGRDQVGLDELADESWLCGKSESSCRALTISSCERFGFTPEVSFESDDYNVMQALIAAGLGVTLLPDLALEMLQPGVAIVEVAGEPPIRRVSAATLAAGARSGATDAMVAILAEVAAGFTGEPAVAAAA